MLQQEVLACVGTRARSAVLHRITAVEEEESVTICVLWNQQLDIMPDQMCVIATKDMCVSFRMFTTCEHAYLLYQLQQTIRSVTMTIVRDKVKAVFVASKPVDQKSKGTAHVFFCSVFWDCEYSRGFKIPDSF